MRLPDHSSSRRRPISVIAALAIVLAGCMAGPAVSAVPTPSQTVSPTPTPTATPSPSPTLIESTVPPELAGTWRRSVGGERVDLSLQVGYSIQRGFARGSGRVTVDGDRIEFHGGSLCDGEGVYTWAIEEDTLTFTMVAVDPCSGRSEVLVPGSFRRYEP